MIGKFNLLSDYLLPGAYERREGASNYCNHQLSNHTFTKTPNMVKAISVAGL